jgi:antitoxin component YwqK of YwqJK toxin-antitoxin module
MQEGIKQGDGTLYDEDGKRIYKGGFDDETYHGKNCTVFYGNGKVCYSGNFKKGEKTGFAKEWYVNGKMKFEGNYVNDMKHGLGKEFHESGALRYEGLFKYGYPSGKMVKTFSDDGCLNFYGEVQNGKYVGHCVEVHQNGK